MSITFTVQNKKYEITTNHPSANYKMPVLLCDEIVYGPADRLPCGLIAGAFVLHQNLGEHRLITNFLACCPELY